MDRRRLYRRLWKHKQNRIFGKRTYFNLPQPRHPHPPSGVKQPTARRRSPRHTKRSRPAAAPGGTGPSLRHSAISGRCIRLAAGGIFPAAAGRRAAGGVAVRKDRNRLTGFKRFFDFPDLGNLENQNYLGRIITYHPQRTPVSGPPVPDRCWLGLRQ